MVNREAIMTKPRRSKQTSTPRASCSLVVRLDKESKDVLMQAAELRGISLSDYVREVTVAQARREVQSAREQVLVLTPEEQLAFWTALNQPPRFTGSQSRLGSLMRGDS
jgi:uncharacterized protein (DUF1778 family)